ncbi:MAG: hypothetical protein HN348_21770, partial [Proteobacteria bacterium]|nr:hypothetical protein [Pseudomonadota bacterium]
RDEDTSQYITERTSGMDPLRQIAGDNAIAYGLRDEESGNIAAGVDFKSFGVSGSYASMEGSQVQFFTGADSLDLTAQIARMDGFESNTEGARQAWVQRNPKKYQELLAKQYGARVRGIDNLSDLDVCQLVNPQFQGSGYVFDNYSATDVEGRLKVATVGVSLGNAEQQHERMVIGQDSDGRVRVTVSTNEMEQTRSGVEVASAGLNFERDTSQGTEVSFTVDPSDAAALASLERMTATGLLPGAEHFMSKRQLTDLDTDAADLRQINGNSWFGDLARESQREELTERTGRFNRMFLESAQLGAAGGVDYDRISRDQGQRQAMSASALGVEVFKSGFSESWSSVDYRRSDDDHRQLGYAFQDEGTSWFGIIQTEDKESSRIAVHPEDHEGMALMMHGDQVLNAESAQLLQQAGAEGWELEQAAAGRLGEYGFDAPRVETRVAIDDRAMDEIVAYYRENAQAASIQRVARTVMMRQENSELNFGISPAEMLLAESDERTQLQHSGRSVLAAELAAEHPQSETEQMLGGLQLALLNTMPGIGELSALAMGELTPETSDLYRQKVSGALSVTSSSEFAELSPGQQALWLERYVSTSLRTEKSPFDAIDMLKDVDNGEGTGGSRRDQLMRRLFREIEVQCGEGQSAPLEFIRYADQLQYLGPEGRALGERLKLGVQVEVLDEGAQKAAAGVAGAIVGDNKVNEDHLELRRRRAAGGKEFVDGLSGLHSAAGGGAAGRAVLEDYLSRSGIFDGVEVTAMSLFGSVPISQRKRLVELCRGTRFGSTLDELYQDMAGRYRVDDPSPWLMEQIRFLPGGRSAH